MEIVYIVELDSTHVLSVTDTMLLEITHIHLLTVKSHKWVIFYFKNFDPIFDFKSAKLVNAKCTPSLPNYLSISKKVNVLN
jgi:hypothetical protein